MVHGRQFNIIMIFLQIWAHSGAKPPAAHPALPVFSLSRNPARSFVVFIVLNLLDKYPFRRRRFLLSAAVFFYGKGGFRLFRMPGQAAPPLSHALGGSGAELSVYKVYR
jgi:hypothetical protein